MNGLPRLHGISVVRADTLYGSSNALGKSPERTS
jgi:hypothetical protein